MAISCSTDDLSFQVVCPSVPLLRQLIAELTAATAFQRISWHVHLFQRKPCRINCEHVPTLQGQRRCGREISLFFGTGARSLLSPFCVQSVGRQIGHGPTAERVPRASGSVARGIRGRRPRRGMCALCGVALTLSNTLRALATTASAFGISHIAPTPPHAHLISGDGVRGRGE